MWSADGSQIAITVTRSKSQSGNNDAAISYLGIWSVPRQAMKAQQPRSTLLLPLRKTVLSWEPGPLMVATCSVGARQISPTK